MPFRYWALILILGIGWGSSMFFNELLVRELGPLQTALGRVGLGALGCWVWLWFRRRPVGVPPGFLRDAFVFGLLQYAVPLAVFPAAQAHITSGEAGIVNAMTPVMVVIISHLWPGGERATVLKTLGVLCGFGGIVALVSPALNEGAGQEFRALVFCMIAPLCYGIAINWVRRLRAVEPAVMTAWSLSAAALTLAPLALLTEGLPHIQRAGTWGALLFIGFVLTSAAFLLLFWLLPRVGATTTSTITFITPVSAVLLGVLFLNEHLQAAHLVGMAAIFAGLVLIDGRLIRRAGAKGSA